jgi:hypothetical protein
MISYNLEKRRGRRGTIWFPTPKIFSYVSIYRMSELSLPREVNYGAPMPALPDGAVSTLMSVQSTNGK